jgi:hypothetical protein
MSEKDRATKYLRSSCEPITGSEALTGSADFTSEIPELKKIGEFEFVEWSKTLETCAVISVDSGICRNIRVLGSSLGTVTAAAVAVAALAATKS